MKIKDTILEIQEENEELKTQIEFLSKENRRLLEEHRDLTEKVNWQNRQIQALQFKRGSLNKELEEIKSLSMFEFADKYCSSESLEEAGHAFARSLGVGVRMTADEVAIDEAENRHDVYVGDDF